MHIKRRLAFAYRNLQTATKTILPGDSPRSVLQPVISCGFSSVANDLPFFLLHVSYSIRGRMSILSGLKNRFPGPPAGKFPISATEININ